MRHRHATETAADLMADDILGMTPAEFGRVHVLLEDYHATPQIEKRRAIRRQFSMRPIARTSVGILGAHRAVPERYATIC